MLLHLVAKVCDSLAAASVGLVPISPSFMTPPATPATRRFQTQTLLPLVADPLGKPVPGSHNRLPAKLRDIPRCGRPVRADHPDRIGPRHRGLRAHLRAGGRFRWAQPLLSRYPMLVLMVLYTTTSLWILAQPITRGG